MMKQVLKRGDDPPGRLDLLKKALEVAVQIGPAAAAVFGVAKYPGLLTQYVPISVVSLLGVAGLSAWYVFGSRQTSWWRAVGVFGCVCIMSAALGLGYKVYRMWWGPLIIAVAPFSGSAEYSQRLDSEVWNQLSRAFSKRTDVSLIALPAQAEPLGLNAKKEAEWRGADAVVWGHRWIENRVEKLDIHFEALHSDNVLDSAERNFGPFRDQREPVLGRFEIEVDVSNDLSYMAFFALGTAKIGRKDVDGAISAFSQAILNIESRRSVLSSDNSMVSSFSMCMAYGQRGGLYTIKRDFHLAVKDFDSAATYNQECGYFGFILGALVCEIRGDYEQALVFAGRIAEGPVDNQKYMGFWLMGRSFLRMVSTQSPPSQQHAAAAAGTLLKAVLLSNELGLRDDEFRLLARDATRALVIFGGFLRLAGTEVEGEPFFRQALNIAARSGDKELLTETRRLVAEVKARSAGPAK